VTASAQESGSGRPLGRPLERLRLRDGLSQHRAHLRQRLDRNDLRPRRHEQARQLPGPGGDGDDDPTAGGARAALPATPPSPTGTPAARAATLERYAREQESRGFSFWAVVERDGGYVIGDAGFGVFRQTGDVELGYTLKRDRWGRGYATEAARACLEAGLARLDVAAVVDTVDVHGRSHRLFAFRLGPAA